VERFPLRYYTTVLAVLIQGGFPHCGYAGLFTRLWWVTSPAPFFLPTLLMTDD
jgi:hypothetical protein